MTRLIQTSGVLSQWKIWICAKVLAWDKKKNVYALNPGEKSSFSEENLGESGRKFRIFIGEWAPKKRNEQTQKQGMSP